MTQRVYVELVCILALAGIVLFPDKSTAVNQREPCDAKKRFHSAPFARYVLHVRNPIQAPAPDAADAELAKRIKPGHPSEQNGAHLSKVAPNIPAHAAVGRSTRFGQTTPRHPTHALAQGVAAADLAIRSNAMHGSSQNIARTRLAEHRNSVDASGQVAAHHRPPAPLALTSEKKAEQHNSRALPGSAREAPQRIARRDSAMHGHLQGAADNALPASRPLVPRSRPRAAHRDLSTPSQAADSQLHSAALSHPAHVERKGARGSGKNPGVNASAPSGIVRSALRITAQRMEIPVSAD
jgi:hypothetical protein